MHYNLTKGPITKSLILFTLPTILSNLLQQLYNIIDTFIVGHIIGPQAIASVGSSFTLMTLLTSMILGLCMGSGVLFSMLYGGEKNKDIKNAFVISFIFISIISLIIQILCLIFLHNILIFMNIPTDIYEQTYQYLFIILIGFFFTFLYNYFASILRSIGNSKTPLFFLALATIINIILDLYFIVELHLGVSGAAIATIIAQAISGIGLMIYTLHTQKELIPTKQDCYFNQEIFKKIKDYSLLTCIQQSVMNFGILLIQGLVNSFGVITMSAFAAAVKIDAFAYMPVQDFGNAFATFIAQNKGAHQTKRIQQGLKKAIIISTLFCMIISFIIYLLAPQLMTIFIDKHQIQIIQQGVEYLRIEGVFYLGIGCLFLLYGYYRGIGQPGISIILTIISLGTRVLISYIFVETLGLKAIWWSIPIGWILADITGIIYHKISSKENL